VGTQSHDTPRVLVFVAKCPIAGKSKTRLKGALGDDGALMVATAMVQDLLYRMALGGEGGELVGCHLVWLYAPADGTALARSLVESLTPTNMSGSTSASSCSMWHLLPMRGSSTSTMTKPDLGVYLKEALRAVREDLKIPGACNAAVAFIGMDTPELPSAAIATALESAAKGSAMICPAKDGGYVCLALPPTAPYEVFDGVQWSSTCTCVSQMGAIARSTSRGIPVLVGQFYEDCDEVDDLVGLATRLENGEVPNSTLFPNGVCPHTRQALASLQGKIDAAVNTQQTKTHDGPCSYWYVLGLGFGLGLAVGLMSRKPH